MTTNIKRNELCSFESEQALLGSLMIECSSFDRVCAIIETTDFLYNEHREIFSAMIEVYNRNNSIDLALVNNELVNHNKFHTQYLLTLQHITNVTSDLTSYAKIIKEWSVKRKYYDILTTAVKELETNSRSLHINDQISQFENAIYKLNQDIEKTEKPIQNIKSSIQEVMQEMATLKNDPNANQGLMSGFIDLDKKTNGFRGGELIVIAARPSCGKTAFGVNILENIFIRDNDKPSLFFSLEMPTKQITQRFISSNFRIVSPTHKTA